MELGETVDSGRRRPIEIKDTEFDINTDIVIFAIGQEIDAQIYQNYYLHPSNFIAAKQESKNITASDKQAFAKHLQAIKPELQETVLKMYANPVSNHIGL